MADDTAFPGLPGSELDLTSVDTLLSTTRSVRRKLDFERSVDPALINDCINLATQAPMGIGGESWRFVVVTDPARKAQIASLYEEVILGYEASRGLTIKATQRALMERMPEMPALIFVYILGTPPGADVAEQIGFYGSILPVAWSLMLALRSRNLGCTWTSLLASRQAEIGALLNVPDGAVLTVMFPVAHTRNAVLKPAQRLDASAVTFWNQWDGNP